MGASVDLRSESFMLLAAVQADRMPLPGIIAFSLGGALFLSVGVMMLRDPRGRGVRMLRRGSLVEASESFYAGFARVFGVVATLAGAGLVAAAAFEAFR
ncbi:hypothetical protein GCM10010400_53910 [Streptomyces aculeolatus]|uniref:hypothetical protein n=1 Tax=Streptomyces aculeolatus TaxID=270689 RepID=UPI001CEC49CC|nr:hypothetical protein [Streptomyces aculeolatus]